MCNVCQVFLHSNSEGAFGFTYVLLLADLACEQVDQVGGLTCRGGCRFGFVVPKVGVGTREVLTSTYETADVAVRTGAVLIVVEDHPSLSGRVSRGVVDFGPDYLVLQIWWSSEGCDWSFREHLRCL